MRSIATPVAAIAAAVLLQTLFPDRAIWHEGWYSIALAALCAYLALCASRVARAAPRRSAAAILVAAFGAGVLAFAGIASGLLAPDSQLVVGAPGATVDVAGLGTIAFPSLESRGVPELVRGGSAAPIEGVRYAGSFVLRAQPRTVIAVDAYDASGRHLTVTQPTGSAFSSPVLLMEQRQRLSGLDLPFDSFSVPAAHRIVKVVLFDARQAALLRGVGSPQPVVLFAVDDETDQPLPHAIRLARSGESVQVGDLRLRARIEIYPAVSVLSMPSFFAVVAGIAMIVAGLVLSRL